MDEATLVEVLQGVALAIALAACAGIRAWLPLLLAGSLHRAGLLQLGPSFEFLGSNRALILFGVASLLEIVGDKIPAVDHGLDAISSVLRPLAGALLAASVLGRFADPLTAIALGIAVGAPTAIVPHADQVGPAGALHALHGRSRQPDREPARRLAGAGDVPARRPGPDRRRAGPAAASRSSRPRRFARRQRSAVRTA